MKRRAKRMDVPLESVYMPRGDNWKRAIARRKAVLHRLKEIVGQMRASIFLSTMYKTLLKK